MLARKTIFIMLCSALAIANSKLDKVDLGIQEIDAQGITVSVSGSYPSDISIGMIEYFEGCTDTLVWPGLNSGPTIGCGIDLGNLGERNIKSVFEGIVDERTVDVLVSAASVRGAKSKAWIRKHPVRLTRQQVDISRDRVVNTMWKLVTQKMPELADAPGEVKTAVLSCAMNRGPNNPVLSRMAPLVRSRKYRELANVFSAMRNDHSLPGLQARRMHEAELIRLAVD